MSSSPRRFLIAITSAGSDEQARSIARGLVENRLAACVNIVGEVSSVYRWEGKIAEESEKLLVIKTEERLFDEVRELIRYVHTYDVPEVIAFPIAHGDHDYLEWLSGSLKTG